MIKNWLEKLKKSSFFVSVFKVGSGQLIAQLLAVVSIPILSRIYNDVAYGDAAMITSTAAILIHFSTLGLNSAVMKPQDDEESKTVFTTAFLVNLSICSLFTAVCAVLFSKFKIFDVSGSYHTALFLMWLYTIFFANSSLLTVYANRKGAYNKLFFNPIIGAVAQFAVAIPLGLAGLGYKGFIITYIVQNLSICLHLMWKDLPFARHYGFSDFKRVMREYKDYVLFQYPSNFVGNVAIEYPTQYLGHIFNTQQLGGYSLCVRVMKYPIRLIAAPISTVYFRTATLYHREGKNLAEFTYKMISKILLISLVPVALFILVSEPVFAFVLGENWRDAGALAAFLVIQYVLLFCSQTTSYCRVSIDRQKMNLFISFVRLFVAMLSCVLGYVIFGTLTATVFCYSLGQCVYNIFDLSVNFYCLDRIYLKKFLLISCTYTLVMYAFVLVHFL